MPRDLPARVKQAITAPGSSEVLVTLIEITHPQLSAPIRLCDDGIDTTHDGNLFESFPFKYERPDVMEGTVPTASITATNVDQRIIEAIADLIEPATVKVTQVLASEPDVPIIPWIDWEMGDVEDDNQNIVIPLSQGVTLDELYPWPTIDQEHFPMAFQKRAG